MRAEREKFIKFHKKRSPPKRKIKIKQNLEKKPHSHMNVNENY